MKDWQPTWWQRLLFREDDTGGWHYTRRAEFVYTLVAHWRRFRTRHLCAGCGEDGRTGTHGMSEYGGCV